MLGAVLALDMGAAPADLILGCNEQDLTSYARDGFHAFVSKADFSKTAACDNPARGFMLDDQDALKIIEQQRKLLLIPKLRRKNKYEYCDGRQ